MAHDRKFRFGVQCLRAASAKEFAEQARRAEDLGFSSILFPDHFVDHPLAPMPAMAAAAAVTTTLRVGTCVLGNDYKHPVVLATEAATVDVLSDGRLELGLGAGWMTVDYERAGLPLDPPGVRIARLAEAITVVKGLMADDPFTFHGKHYDIDELDGEPKPVQKPHPPLIVGGGGPKILGLAAREAQIIGINARLTAGTGEHESSTKSLNPASTDEKVQWVREAAGDRFDELELQSLVGFVMETDDVASTAEMMAGAFDTTPEEALDTPVVLVGTIDEMVERLQRRRARWALSYHVVPIEQMETFAPVVARLAGT
ncbi:MAG: TIGR03621 family F420-dependent LLM class oxidoreductase [Actinobacteria bacterium]|nr:MAG: TIGR03621 family F420-dependent LLM class oxidoreductase [Actinomycetota bacterium]